MTLLHDASKSPGVRDILLRTVTEATAKAESAMLTLKTATNETRRNASREVRATRIELLMSYRRLSEFLNKGIVPDDLKRSG